MMPSFNALIGIAFLAAIPPFVIWTTFSFLRFVHISRVGYRFAVTYFLTATTILTCDFARLRFMVHILGFPPDSTTWLVFLIRWNWVVSVWYTTIVLYGRAIAESVHNLFSAFRILHDGDDHRHRRDRIPNVEHLHETHLDVQEERINSTLSQLESIAQQLNGYIQRIKQDDPLFPDTGVKG